MTQIRGGFIKASSAAALLPHPSALILHAAPLVAFKEQAAAEWQ